MVKTTHIILALCTIFLLTNCKKDKAEDYDYRSVYVGKWNFKQTVFTYSGYYVYGEPGTSPQWTYTTNTNVSYNDGTGSISLGSGKDELLLKYSSTGPERIINLTDNNKGSWSLTSTAFHDDVQPSPPSYSSYYQTIEVTGKKL